MIDDTKLLERVVYALDTLIATQPSPDWHPAAYDHADAVSEEVWEYLRQREIKNAG